MKWISPKGLAGRDARYITSECGAFRIHRWQHDDAWLYTAARIVPQPSVIVLGRASLESCKRACEELAND